MRVGQLQILTGDEIRDGQKLRTPLNVGRERERETLPIAREREVKVDDERETPLLVLGWGLGSRDPLPVVTQVPLHNVTHKS